MGRTRKALSAITDEFHGIMAAGGCLYAATFFMWEMISTGSISNLNAALITACASVPGALGYSAARAPSRRHPQRSIRVYFPVAAALLCAQSVILPVYLAAMSENLA